MEVTDRQENPSPMARSKDFLLGSRVCRRRMRQHRRVLGRRSDDGVLFRAGNFHRSHALAQSRRQQ